jgi:glycosyltransferase involved in cell wall biosynthesis
MKRLHVCYISQEYPPETGWGGIGSYTYEMANALASDGHRVTVISRAVNQESFKELGGVAIHRVAPKPKWDSVPVAWRMNRIWPGFAWAAMLKLRAIHKQTPVDVVEAAEGRADAFFVSYLPRRPKLVTRLHTARKFVDELNIGPREAHRFEYWLEKKSILRANLLTAPSQAVIDLTRTWLTLKDANPFVIPNPVDEQKFRPSTFERKNSIVYTGRLERRKGVHVIAEAIPMVLEKFPAAEFLFLGSDGTDRDGVNWRDKLLSSLEADQRKQLAFEQKSRDSLVHAYQEAAMCILPSVWENFPYALLEAMSCGTPVIASNAGGFPELIEDGVSGFLVPVNDAKALAARIIELLEAPSLRARIGDHARQRVETLFSPRQVVPPMIAAYEQAIASS